MSDLLAKNDEVSDQLDYLRKRGMKFVIAIPELQIF
jgi:hypothetical protein